MALVILFTAMFLGDTLVSLQPVGIPQIYWALLDAPVHAVIALLAIWPLLFNRVSLQQAVLRGLAAGFITIMLDVDHFAAARTFSLYDALHLANRPITHSLLFAILCGLTVRLIAPRGVFAWAAMLLLVSHVIRDASTGGTPLLWPLSPDQVSLPVYYVAHAFLFLLSTVLVAIEHNPSRSAKQVSRRLCPVEAQVIRHADRERS